MAGAIGIAAALRARHLQRSCPRCGHVKPAERKPAADRVGPRCKRPLPEPAAAPRTSRGVRTR